MEIIGGQENFQEPVSRLPVLPRLDRLDRWVNILLVRLFFWTAPEERQSLSKRLSTDFNKKADPEDQPYSTINELEDPRKSLSSVLEEVHQKGTLIERLTMLENRVIQLSLDMDEGYNSSKNVPTSNKLGHDSVWSTTTTEGDEDKKESPQEKDYYGDAKGGVLKKGSRVTEHSNLTDQYAKKGKRNKHFKKMFGWFSMGC